MVHHAPYDERNGLKKRKYPLEFLVREGGEEAVPCGHC